MDHRLSGKRIISLLECKQVSDLIEAGFDKEICI